MKQYMNQYMKPYMHLTPLKLLSKGVAAFFLIALFTITATAQETPPETKKEKAFERTQMRFLTSNDFPPFNYYDEEGNLSGFHIDLANAICREMRVQCDIKVTDWNKLKATFKTGDFDAIIAGLAINETNLRTLDFTNPYMRLPARFAILKSRPQPLPKPSNLYGKKIGVLATSAHDAYLMKFFKKSKVARYSSQQQATSALQEGKVDYLFGDAIGLMFWLNGSLSKQCCGFHGKAYWDETYFGQGLAMAIAKGNMRLRIEINDAIDKIRKSGEFAELMLRYFPMKIY